MDRFRMLPNYQYHDDDTGVLETHYKKGIRNYQIYGNSVQDGEPNSDSSIELQGVGEKTINLWGKETAIAEGDSYGTLTYEWDNKGGIYFFNTSVVAKTCSVELTLSAGTYSVWMSRYGYIRKNGSLVKGGYFATVSSTADFVLQTETILNTKENTYFQVMVVEGTYIEDTMPEFEPQGKYKIPIEVSNENAGIQTYNIFLDEPLTEITDYIDYKNQSVVTSRGLTKVELPKIQLNKGKNTIKVKTTIQPSQVNWQYYK